jgi:hypothetical protein
MSLTQGLVATLPKRSHKKPPSDGFIREMGLSTNTVDNFVDKELKKPASAFAT